MGIKKYIIGTTVLACTILIIFIIYKIYAHFSQCNNCEERIYPSIKQLEGNIFKESIMVVADKTLNSNKMFIFNYPLNLKFETVFKSDEDKAKAKIGARDFFKNNYGLTDSYLNMFMWEYRVNSNINQRAYFIQGSKNKNIKVQDGGYTVYLPIKRRLYGKYGGKEGVLINKSSRLIYGYYIIGDKYKIKYWSQQPQIEHHTYDATYTPIDYELKIEGANNKKLIGLKGKAHGLYKKINIKGLTKHMIIRNVMTFI